MLQTIQATPDASAQGSQGIQARDKDVQAKDRQGGTNTFYSQFMAALPPVNSAQPQPDPVPARDREPGPESPSRQAQAKPGSQAQGKDRLAARKPGQAEDVDADGPEARSARSAREARARRPATTAKPAVGLTTAQLDNADALAQLATDPDPDPAAADATPADPALAGATAAAAANTAATAQAKPGAADPTTDGKAGADALTLAKTQAGADALTLVKAQAGSDALAIAKGQAGSDALAATKAQAGTDAGATGKAQAGPDGIAAAKAQAALEQLLPGGKLPFQFGDPAAQASSKPALSEFMNQLQAEIQSPSFKGVGGASGEAVPLVAPASTGPDPQALLPAAQAAALALGAPPKENAPANTGLPANFTPAEAVGAGAAPGASGAVRVTAPGSPEALSAPRRENPMAQVDSSIRWLIKNKEHSAELQLHPEALGRVQVKITVEGTEVHAKLWASEAAAMPVLQEHRAFLETSLKAQGLTLGSFDLQHGQQQNDQSPLPRPDPSPPPLSLNPAPARLEQATPAAVTLGPSGGNRIEIVA